MNPIKTILAENQLDFLREMMNVGSGNAATALTQLLGTNVDLTIPAVKTLPVSQVSALFHDPSLPVFAVRMYVLGDISGEIYFIVPDEHKRTLIDLVKQAAPGPKRKDPAVDLSVLMEIGNITAGVFSTAIHRFCELSIYHTVPIMAMDMVQSIVDESIADISRESKTIILLENEFIVNQYRIGAFFLVIPAVESIPILLGSIEKARMAYGSE